MSDNTKKSNKTLLTVLLVLAVLVASTFFALGDVLRGFFMDTSDAVEIGPQGATTQITPQPPQENIGTEPQQENTGTEPQQETAENTTKPSAQQGGVTLPGEKRRPGFTVRDDDGKRWGVDTEFEIFKVSYDGTNDELTVIGANGDKVIAPGTEHSYTFKLKNTGETNMWYYLDVDAYITPSEIKIPVQTRIIRYDGLWIAGDKDTFVDTDTLNKAEDDNGLGSGKYTYYTLEWMWPFESGNDEYDTWLGDTAVDKTITMTIEMTVTAVSYADGADMGITLPNTGDVSSANKYIILMSAAACIIIVILLLKRKEKEEENR